ncbi:molybdate ABC transporter substrate-binding protein [Echinicola rosea]|uniref:Molybdate ABC transporter substrate-binding protein n=1 Tax=Echinicola rosea TaxID=1807691 RepID=A0ABQ1UZR0_9BACT|nr:molybdate ABC transporter substrate-binding protein [Echinicola rosea]GGF30590.1 molybdate ABC transporter substrate-binding protein [Echinicola rosea]
MKPIHYLLLVVMALTGCQAGNNEKVTIATAANMQFAMEALIKAFEAESGIACQMVVSSSGKLTAQIKGGAPYDIFVAANVKYPKAIHDAGLASAPPKIYAHGALVLWTLDDELSPSLEMLSDPNISHIAIANPKTAPYGLAAMEVLKKNKLAEVLNDKLVFGESISQTNQYILSKSAEMGFTSLSVVKSPRMIGKGKWFFLNEGDYSPIKQAAVIIKRNESENSGAIHFYEYLFTEEAQKILKEYGYQMPR